MKTVKWIAQSFMILAACMPWVASAGQKQGRISSVHLAQGHIDKVFIKIEGSYSQSQSEPNCSVGVSGWDFVLNIATSTGRAIYAQVLAAQYSQTPLLVVGNDDCLLHMGYETLSYIVAETG